MNDAVLITAQHSGTGYAAEVLKSESVRFRIQHAIEEPPMNLINVPAVTTWRDPVDSYKTRMRRYGEVDERDFRLEYEYLLLLLEEKEPRVICCDGDSVAGSDDSIEVPRWVREVSAKMSRLRDAA